MSTFTKLAAAACRVIRWGNGEAPPARFEHDGADDDLTLGETVDELRVRRDLGGTAPARSAQRNQRCGERVTRGLYDWHSPPSPNRYSSISNREASTSVIGRRP
jgi:hypothetical protein